jgi:hypothetical protein
MEPEQQSRYNLEEEHYIEDDYLSRNIDLCSIEGSNDDKFILHFCMFVINKECFIQGVNEKVDDELFLYYDKFFPFLQFYMKKIDGVYQFPQMDFKCAVPNEMAVVADEMVGGEDETPQSQVYFENECFRFLTTFFEDAGVIHSLPANYISTMYKGFKEFQQVADTTKHIFVFYDITGCIQYFKKEERALAIIDEIVFNQKINKDAVNPIYFQFFKENKNLLYMKSGDTKIPYPFQLYMCKKTENNEGTLTSVQVGDSIRTIEHNDFGPSYIFTAEPFGDNPVRFSCFIIKSIYFLQDIAEEPVVFGESSTKEGKPVEETKEVGESEDGEKGEMEGEEQTFEDINEKTPVKGKEDFLYVPTIYYWENGVQYWCIRNNNHFTGV